MNDFRHLSREEQKLLADVAKLVREDEQEFNYDMLKIEAPEQASGEFWFRMAEMLSTLPPNQSLDLRMNGGRLTVAVSILSVLLQDKSGCSAALGTKNHCAQLFGSWTSNPCNRFSATA